MDNSVPPSFDHAISTIKEKKQLTKHHKQPEAYITNNQCEEPLEQKNTLTVPGKITYAEAIKFEKNNCVIGDSHLYRIKKNIFQKSVNGEKHALMFFEALHLGN